MVVVLAPQRANALLMQLATSPKGLVASDERTSMTMRLENGLPMSHTLICQGASRRMSMRRFGETQ